MIISIMICILTEPAPSSREIREKLKVELIKEIRDRVTETRNAESENIPAPLIPLKPITASNV